MLAPGWRQLFSDLVKERYASVSESPILFRKMAWRAGVVIRGMWWESRLVLRSLARSGMSSWNLEAAGERAGIGIAMSFITWSCIRVGRRNGSWLCGHWCIALVTSARSRAELLARGCATVTFLQGNHASPVAERWQIVDWGAVVAPVMAIVGWSFMRVIALSILLRTSRVEFEGCLVQCHLLE